MPNVLAQFTSKDVYRYKPFHISRSVTWSRPWGRVTLSSPTTSRTYWYKAPVPTLGTVSAVLRAVFHTQFWFYSPMNYFRFWSTLCLCLCRFWSTLPGLWFNFGTGCIPGYFEKFQDLPVYFSIYQDAYFIDFSNK